MKKTVWWLAGLLVAMCAVALWPDAQLDDWRQMVRATARTSWLLFMGLFVATATPRGALAPHRGSLALGFLLSHLLHAAGILALHVLSTPEQWAQLAPVASRWVGGAGYVALAAALLWRLGADRRTSPRLRMPAATGPAALWVLWLVFWLSCAKRAPAMPAYAVPAVLMLVAAVWRVLAQRQSEQLTQVG